MQREAETRRGGFVVRWVLATLLAAVIEASWLLRIDAQQPVKTSLCLVGTNALAMLLACGGLSIALHLVARGYGLAAAWRQLQGRPPPERNAILTSVALVGLTSLVLAAAALIGLFHAATSRIATASLRGPALALASLVAVLVVLAVAPGLTRVLAAWLLRRAPSFVLLIAGSLLLVFLAALFVTLHAWRHVIEQLASQTVASLALPVLAVVAAFLAGPRMRWRRWRARWAALAMVAAVVASLLLLANQRLLRWSLGQGALHSRLVVWMLPREAPPAPGDPSRLFPAVSPSEVPAGARHLVLVTIDALRFDRLDMQRDGAPLMPRLASFAQGAWRFDAAYVAVPHTAQALGTLLTGRYVNGLAWSLGSGQDAKRRVQLSPHLERTTSLAEMLSASGFDTILVSATGYIDAPGLTQGFARVVTAEDNPDFPPVDEPRDRAVAEAAVAVLSEREEDRRQFAWIHFYEPHYPYLGGGPFGDGEQGRYDAEVGRADEALGRLLEGLAEQGMADTVIVVAGDHGEEHGEHGLTEHGRSLFLPGVHVPLVVAAPGLGSGRVTRPVSLIDVVPTVLELLAIAPAQELDGRSLVRAMGRGGLPERTLVLALYPSMAREPHAFAAVRDRHKLHADAAGVPQALYDVVSDPAERRNLVDDEAAIVEELARDLATYRSRSAVPGSALR